MSNEVRERAKARREESYRLGREMLSFEASPSFSGMGRFVRNENLVLSDRLRAVEAALQRGVVSEEDVRNPGTPPRPEAFGLVSDAKPSRFTQDQKVRMWAIGEKAYLPAMAVCAVAVGIWLHLTSNPLLICIFMGAVGGVFGFVCLMLAGTIIFMALEGSAPGAAAWRKWKAAKDRHEILVAAKRVLAAESDVKAFDRANGPEFERLCARAFRRHGYRVEEMGGANDGGVDLLVWKGSFHAIVQCKAHAKPLAPAVVRELHGTLGHHKGASVAYLATTKGVSENAREWAKGKPIIILQPDHLIRGQF